MCGCKVPMHGHKVSNSLHLCRVIDLLGFLGGSTLAKALISVTCEKEFPRVRSFCSVLNVNYVAEV